MSVRSKIGFALVALLLGSQAALADVIIPVTTYSTANGDGIDQLGTFNYLDHTYSGTSPAINSTTPNAPLTGGTGLLTNGVIPTVNWASAPTEYVGWKYQDPVLTFNLTAGQTVNSLNVYVALSTIGLVGAPSLKLSIDGGQTFIGTVATPTVVPGTDGNTGILSLLFPSGLSSSDTFTLMLDRGPIQADGNAYHAQFPGDDQFTQLAFLPQLEPWVMVSEVQFLTAVPEPATWIMMIAGFAGLGFAAYRRRSRLQPKFA
jgi:hypothetical protein